MPESFQVLFHKKLWLVQSSLLVGLQLAEKVISTSGQVRPEKDLTPYSYAYLFWEKEARACVQRTPLGQKKYMCRGQNQELLGPNQVAFIERWFLDTDRQASLYAVQ